MDQPPRYVRADQVVAYNMAAYRKEAGLTQEQLAEQLASRTRRPWSKASVSAAERSWDGDRPKFFDATQLLALADIFRVPVPALLLPPVGEEGTNLRVGAVQWQGTKERPEPTGKNRGWELDGAALLDRLFPGADDDHPLALYYQARVSEAFAWFVGSDQYHVTMSVDALEERLDTVNRQRVALAQLASELTHEAKALVDSLATRSRGTRK